MGAPGLATTSQVHKSQAADAHRWSPRRCRSSPVLVGVLLLPPPFTVIGPRTSAGDRQNLVGTLIPVNSEKIYSPDKVLPDLHQVHRHAVVTPE
jgi:hypothetical protein